MQHGCRAKPLLRAKMQGKLLTIRDITEMINGKSPSVM